ncbi:MAG: alkylation response protein AidB-like acyl-CoA dehydrogenase [Nitriliruptoraceae bacterium]|jgi:alkylation response protein AidB-like acyl-CoA dehydrogenase
MTQTIAPTDPQQAVRDALDALFVSHPPATTEHATFWGAQYDAGLAWVQFPVGIGGLGVSPRLQAFVNDAIVDAGGSVANRRHNVLAIGMGGPVLATHGTSQQQERWLRPMFTTEEIWCQLFSEPGAGSDLAGLSTSAVPEGDTWIVNGQKVWTTYAHTSRWGMLVTRTDPDVPKHAGMTYFILDMQAPGVEIKPLYQITGEAEFNEVWMTDVHIPDDDRIAEVGEGWTVAMTTLSNERVAIGSNIPERGEGAIMHAVEAWLAVADRDEPVARDRLVQLWVEAEAMRLTAIRANENRKTGNPGPEGSTGKLHWSELNKAITEFGMELLGADGMLYPPGYEFSSPELSATTRNEGLPQLYLRARANSIEGGTSEILKNILGERVLGLPGEPRVDKNIPFREIPRG